MRYTMPLVLLGLSTAASADEPRPPWPTSNPQSWITTEDYPARARRDDAEGTVTLSLVVTPLGKVGSCSIEESSGNALLDERACELVTLRGSFEPATDDDGNAVEGKYRTRVAWRLEGTRKPPEPGKAVATFVVDVDGNLTDCSVTTEGSFSDAMSPAMCTDPTNSTRPYVDSEGEPVAKRVTITMQIDVEDAE